MTDIVPIRRALVSVSDKAGLVALCGALTGQGAQVLTTGGSAALLRGAGVAVTEVADHTGFPEILDGRVKTLVPQIHGGILGRRDLPSHRAEMDAHGIAPIDLVAVNLYPFAATVARGADFETCVENIDIGGPALLRAAAKNHQHVVVLCDPAQYAEALDEIARHGGTTLALRRRLAAAAFAHTAAYDAAVAAWFAKQQGEAFPPVLTLAATRVQALRYGENPHQQAALYATADGGGIARAAQVQGKELGYNNIADADAALACVAEFDRPAVVIVKHANPCGVAVADSPAEAWDRALACDPVSAFGGIVALNRVLDEATAARIAAIFTEVIVAPGADAGAREVLGRKKNLRLLLTGAAPLPAAMVLRAVAGGMLVQTPDAAAAARERATVVTRRAPTEQEWADLLFAMLVAKHVRSNAIVYARGGATVGIGAGQMSRVDAARIAAWKAEEAGRAAGLAESPARGSVVASDAFFPFADGLQAALAAGATAVIQPGGSLRDAEVIAAADAAGAAMVFSGTRHFRH